MTPSYQPLVILGAGRSGTNILRDVLTALPGFATWPCDEINYIWRHGNLGQKTDEFPPELARPGVIASIRRAFDRRARIDGSRWVVEKTCANTLRVGFVDRVLPEAKYLFLVRDGRAVAASARKRWTAPLDLPYVLQKARFVPPLDLPWYAGRYGLNRLYRLVSGRKRLASWGPRFAGMEEALRERTLIEVCALQWQRCLERAEEDLARIPPQRVFRLRYEPFVDEPTRHLEEILNFLGEKATPEEIAAATARVSGGSRERWQKDLTPEEQERLEPLIGDTLRRLGYA